MAQACEAAAANDNIGYNQAKRNDLNTQARLVLYDLARIKTPTSCDCSSLMTVCAQAAGIAVPYTSGNAPTTRTMRYAFKATGMFDVLTESAYLTTDAYLKRGDILVSEGRHTVMVLENGHTDKLPVLKLGCTGPFVEKAQAKLRTYGYKINIDGEFGPITKQAVISFQGEKGLKKDGIIGEATWAALNK